MERSEKTINKVPWFANDEVLGNLQAVMEAVLGAIGVALPPSPALLRRAPSPAEGRGEVEGYAR
jgi:hypothetical protein